MEEAAPDYGHELDIYNEYVPSKADALDWYKWGRPYRTFRPRTMRYYSGKKVTKLNTVITGDKVYIFVCSSYLWYTK